MAFRCRHSEETRAFYEGVIGLRLVRTFQLLESKTGRTIRALHTFYEMADHSTIAFFEVPDMPFDFREQHDFDLHIALLTGREGIDRARNAALAQGIEVRGPSDHGFITSHYFRDPNGYVVELCETPHADRAILEQTPEQAADALKRWTVSKSS